MEHPFWSFQLNYPIMVKWKGKLSKLAVEEVVATIFCLYSFPKILVVCIWNFEAKVRKIYILTSLKRHYDVCDVKEKAASTFLDETHTSPIL